MIQGPCSARLRSDTGHPGLQNGMQRDWWIVRPRHGHFWQSAATPPRQPPSGKAADKESWTIPIRKKAQPSASGLLSLVESSLEDDKAQEISCIDLHGKTTFADQMVIASGTSSRQIAAMADHLVERLKAAGHEGATVDGKNQGDWILVDAGDVIVHLFRPEVREFYRLERLWGDDAPSDETDASVATA